MTKESDRLSRLKCEQCGGNMSLPEDATVLSMKCGYCSHEMLIPQSILAEREKHAKAAMQSEKQQREVQEQRQVQKSILVGRVLKLTMVLILVIGVAGMIWYISDLAQDKRPTDERSTGMTAATKWLAARRDAGCSYVVTAPGIHSGNYGWEATLKKGGDCVQVMASVDDGQTTLAFKLTTPDMQVLNAQKSGAVWSVTHCGKQDGKYPVSIVPSSNNWFTFAAIACPRTMYEKPLPEDSVSTGADAVATRMKTLYEMGCKSIVHVPKTARGSIEWTPDFPKSKRRDCLNIMAMTGIKDNILTATMKNAFGETLPAPAPGTAIDYMLCSDTGGPHPIVISATTDQPYTFAAVGCPRKIGMKLTQK